MTRPRALAVVLMIATLIIFWLCYWLIVPFLPALAWGLALAVIAHPIHRRIQRLVSRENIAAGISVALVLAVIVAPVVFVSNTLFQEARKMTETVRENLASGEWKRHFEADPRWKPVVHWLSTNLLVEELDAHSSETEDTNTRGDTDAEDPRSSSGGAATTPSAPTDGDSFAPDRPGADPSPTQLSRPPRSQDGNGEQMAGRALSAVSSGLGAVVTGGAWIGMQFFVTLMCLFYFLRDRHHVLAAVRSLMPLAPEEADEVFSQVDDTIHATIFGSLMVALVQGCMGGLIFWLLGIPSPVLWGAIMGLLAVVPVLGTFVIWAPTAVFLAMKGEWGKAMILASWGGIAIGLIDNLLYPYLVGKRLQFHTILVFFAIVGGLAQFGASGVILGPLILAVAGALLEIWKRRTADGGTLEVDVECGSP